MINKSEFINFMINANVLRFGDFVTKSGRNTPYFINTGNYSTGKELSTLGNFYANLIKDTCSDNFTAIFGPAYKGIPLASAVSIALSDNFSINKEIFFNRKEKKDHGEGGSLIGYNPIKNDTVIIVEDVITAGTALRESMELLKDYNLNIKDMFISVDRCEKGYNEKTAVQEAMDTYGIKVHSIVTINDIIEFLEKEDTKFKQYTDKMKEYLNKYCVA